MNTKCLNIIVFFLSITSLVYAQDDKERKVTTEIIGNNNTVIINFLNQLADYKTPKEIDEIRNILVSLSGQNEQQNEQLMRLLQQLIDFNSNTNSEIVNLKDSVTVLNEKILYNTKITEESKTQINAITNVILPPPIEPEMAIGFCFGPNFTNMFFSPSLKTTKWKSSRIFGLVLENNFGKNAFQFGLLYATLGCEFEGDFMGFTKGIFELNYLDIIPTYLYKLNNSDETPFLRGRIYLGYGLSGKIKEVDGTEEKVEKVKFSGEEDKICNPDLGFGLGLGWQFNRLQIVFEGNLGWNISNDENFSIKNYGFSLNITWLFKNISQNIFK